MPADIGEMFYTGAIPWHGQGLELSKPATMDEALRAGGLNWDVGDMALITADDPPSPVERRKAIVRLDRPAGHDGRVVGIVHQDFRPVQNRDGAMLFDAIFGHGEAVYHTGGYIGNGEKIWLLAKVNAAFEVGKGDGVDTYALLANSHDGSTAFHIRLTTVRVVCSNTLSMAIKQRKFGQQFRRAHQGSFQQHAAAAQEYFAEALSELQTVGNQYGQLSQTECSDEQRQKIVESLLPAPTRPRNADRYPGLLKAWEKKRDDVQQARKKIVELCSSGKGVELPGVRGTYWGVLNAILEYVDHFKETKGSKLTYALLGDGMDLKMKAFKTIHEMATAA